MSSRRYSDSFPSESNQTETQVPQSNVEPRSRPPTSPYVPHVFDLVTPIDRAMSMSRSDIPSIYLQSEAIDSSVALGQGASFTASRQSLPPLTESRQISKIVDMGGWTIQASSPKNPRPKYVVYKSANVEFQDNGEPVPRHRRALQSVLTEFHALLHTPLYQHPNIIKFLGLGWGSSPFQVKQKLPVLVLEYADLGTLTQYQSRNNLNGRMKNHIALGIARGLQIMHENEIIHGDIKPDNILMCSDHKEGVTPKLADFGYSIMAATETEDTVSLPGTKTWRSPEMSLPVLKTHLKYADVYSLGLLIWSIAIDGKSPFKLLLSESLTEEEFYLEIDRMKREDRVLSLSSPKKWFIRWLSIPILERMSLGRALSSSQKEVMLERLLAILGQGNADPKDPILLALPPAVIASFQQTIDDLGINGKLFNKSIEHIFHHSLGKDPATRNLRKIIEMLENPDLDFGNNVSHQAEETSTMESPSQFDGDQWLSVGFKARWLSWQKMRQLDPPISSFITSAFMSENTGQARFFLCACFVNGYGVVADRVKACRYLLAGAQDYKHHFSQAFCYRILRAMGAKIVEDKDNMLLSGYLEIQSLYGSPAALVDLEKLDPKMAHKNRSIIRYFRAGVGSLWYAQHDMIGNFGWNGNGTTNFPIDKFENAETVRQLRVNRRGDGVIHFAAACGDLKLIQSLLGEKYALDKNQLNDSGETPLLCACRSGHFDIVGFLLDCGADASIQAPNGEHPLQWLISFSDEDIEHIAYRLVESGRADVKAFVHSKVNHGQFQTNSGPQGFPMGTPLAWAVTRNRIFIVKILLRLGSEPTFESLEGHMTPLELASSFHYIDCLQLMVEHLEVIHAKRSNRPKGWAVMWSQPIPFAIKSADKFSMILHHGENWRKKMHETFTFFMEKSQGARLDHGMGKHNETLLWLAVSNGNDEAVKWIIENKWYMEEGEINQPAGPRSRSPFHEAVRWNRRDIMQLLIQNKADPLALAPNPFDESKKNWSALHVFANESIGSDPALASDLVELGLPVDGITTLESTPETPFSIAVRRNSFQLADRLLELGADMNALSITSSIIVSEFPMSIMGHIIALNARYSSTRIQFLLNHSSTDREKLFIVEPERNISVLHRCALASSGLKNTAGEIVVKEEFDKETNAYITREILQGFNRPEHLEARCAIEGKTALQIAVEEGNFPVAAELIKEGADLSVVDLTALAADQLKKLIL